MKKIVATIKMHAGEHPVAALIAAAVLATVLWLYAGGVITGVKNLFAGSAVQKTEAQASAAESQASGSTAEADRTSADRKVEDRVREQIITPEVERTKRASELTRERLRQAEVNHEKAIKGRGGDGLDDRALHERNCSDLAELYPGEHFEGCGQ
jgi:hypothetical protein